METRLPKNPWVKESIRRKIRKYFEVYKIENTTNQNLRNAAKAEIYNTKTFTLEKNSNQ